MSVRADSALLLEVEPFIRLELLRTALSDLGDREREVWVDVTLAGESQRSIARRDGVTESAVAHCFRRAQRKIERALIVAEIGPESTKAVAA